MKTLNPYVIEGACHCGHQVVHAQCVKCWAYIRRGNTRCAWMYFRHNGRGIAVLNLGALWDSFRQRKWQAVRNMLRVLVRERPKLAWRRDWTPWMDA